MDFNSQYKVKESFGTIETHEVFLDALAQTKEADLGISEKKFEVKINAKVLYAMLVVFFMVASVLFGKTFYLQIVEGNALSIISQNNKGKIDLVRPERGIIYDVNFKKLVLNAPAYDVVCDKKSFSESPNKPIPTLETMANIVGRPYADLYTQITTSETAKVLVAENVEQKKLLVLEANLHAMPGCTIEKNTVRNYLFGSISTTK